MKNVFSALVAAIVVAVSGICMADPVGGTATARGVLLPGASIDYQLVLGGDELTLIEVNGRGTSDLDCYLYDENGGEVDRDDDTTDSCVLRVRPRWTGRFSLTITNVGSRLNTFTAIAR